MTDCSRLIKSSKNPEAQYSNFLTIGSGTGLGAPGKEAIKESLIQRFEICYDTLWKTLKRYLVEELGVPEVLNSPRALFRIAAENKLLHPNAEQWLRYAGAGTHTPHNHSGKKSRGATALMGSFIPDAISLLAKKTGSTWEQQST